MAIQTYIYKHIMDVFNCGDLIRIKATGEVFIYHSATGGANWSCYVTIDTSRLGLAELPSLRLHEVEKVDKKGTCIDDFSQYR